MAFRVIAIGMVLVGSMVDLGAAFGFADLTMGLLALVNLFALVLLFPIGKRLMEDFDAQLRAKGPVVFDIDQYADLDIDREAWTLHPEDQAALEARRANPV